MKTFRVIVAVIVTAFFAFTNLAFAQAVSPEIDLIEFKISGGDTPDEADDVYLYLDSEKLITVPGFCNIEASAPLCGPNSGPDYNGTELVLIDFLVDNQNHPYHLKYVRTGKVWKVFRPGTPGTVNVHRIWVHPWQRHTYASETERYGGENILALMATLPEFYQDDGASFAVKETFDGFVEGWLPLSQACGGEKQTGLTPMIRSYNGNEEGNHQLTTRTDASYFEEMKQAPGWENVTRDMDTTDRQAGVWCVPAVSDKLVQSTAFSNAPGDGENGVWLQLQVHDLSLFSLSAENQISLAEGYEPVRYSTTNNNELTWTARFGVDSNRGVIALSRGLGGYVEYGGVEEEPLDVLPKASLFVETDWATVTVDEESGIVYGISVTDTIRFHAYDPKGNRYVWNYTVPEEYREYYPAESDLHQAGQYLVTFFQTWNDRTNLKGALLVFGNLSGATPEVRIFDLPGPNHNITDFSYDAKANIGYFANARGRSLHKLDFNDWSLSEEALPFQPFALLADPDGGELYVTEVPRYDNNHSYVYPQTGGLWKRALAGEEWVLMSELGYTPQWLIKLNLSGTSFLVSLNTSCNLDCSQIDFVEAKTGNRVPAFANELFGGLYWKRGLDVLNLRQ